MAKEKTTIQRVHCNACSAKRNHKVITTHTQYGSEPYDDEYDVSWTTIYELLECCGCDEMTFRSRHYFSEWNDGDVQETYFPPRIARRLPAWKDKLPENILEMLMEVYAALQADSRRLAVMGARALIDMVMLEKVGDVGSFPEKLTALETAGFLSKENRKALTVALSVGNAASHRGHCPIPSHIEHVMDIVENLLQSTVLHQSLQELEKGTPRRSKKVKPT